MENFIITEKCKTIRTLGREALRGRWKLAFVTLLVYSIAVYVPNIALSAVFSEVPGIASLYSLLITGPFTLGYSIFALRLFRNDEPKVGMIFYGFERFGTSLGLYIVISLLIMMWSLLIIPGVILAVLMPFFAPFVVLLAIPAVMASIRYSQAFYILADYPEKGIMECIECSKMIMAGNKLKYLLLGLSFIGWALLACIPFAVVGGVFYTRVQDALFMTNDIQVLAGAMPAAMVSSLVLIFLMIYVMASFTAFYEMAAGNLRPGYIETTAEIIEDQQNMIGD